MAERDRADSMNYWFPQVAQQAPQAATHPLLDLSDPKYGEIYNNKTMRDGRMVDEEGSFVSPLEDAVDAYTQKRKMNENDTFPVLDPSGEQVWYRYLGPNSGGRKDWMAIPTPKYIPTS